MKRTAFIRSLSMMRLYRVKVSCPTGLSTFSCDGLEAVSLIEHLGFTPLGSEENDQGVRTITLSCSGCPRRTCQVHGRTDSSTRAPLLRREPDMSASTFPRQMDLLSDRG